ncbi:DUF2934 domain-containing protein [Asaia astilbis]|uniref:DUF2934 domain-containing protein n=1 Tax=Asaia astilbis TaxID=610244 RepID=UPI000472D6A9|nr:DUF2934 domain-containing protein [Asaia astilbis]
MPADQTPTNPLIETPERTARIKAKAQELWQAEGKPDGGPEAYRERAADLVGMEEHPDAGEIPVTSLPDAQFANAPVENAEIQKNLGEFPDKHTDQGERDHFPDADNTKS